MPSAILAYKIHWTWRGCSTTSIDPRCVAIKNLSAFVSSSTFCFFSLLKSSGCTTLIALLLPLWAILSLMDPSPCFWLMGLDAALDHVPRRGMIWPTFVASTLWLSCFSYETCGEWLIFLLFPRPLLDPPLPAFKFGLLLLPTVKLIAVITVLSITIVDDQPFDPPSC